MTRTHREVRYAPKGKRYTAVTAAQSVEDALKVLEGRWKLILLFRLFGGKVLRFSDLERAIPAISQKMLIQQLRQMEADGVVHRTVFFTPATGMKRCGLATTMSPAEISGDGDIPEASSRR